MPRLPLTNEEILRMLRFSEENRHRRCREYFFDDGALTLPLSLPIPQVKLEHIQDSCNKSTAIYSITPHFEPHTHELIQDCAVRRDIAFSIYEQWFSDHNVDIDFGNFVTKLIQVKIPFIEQRPTVGVITNIHKAWCEHVEINLPLCSRKKDSKGVEFDDPSYEWNGALGIVRRQNMHYRLKPLFRALIMIIDQNSSPYEEKIVHLLLTDIPSELSAPITFESITPELESDESLGCHNNNNLITTTLSAAIDFVTALESREAKAFPENQRDPSIIDERAAAPGHFTKRARALGHTGPEVQGTSSGWVKLAEGESVLPPLTPLVMQRKGNSGITDKTFLARYGHNELRQKYQTGWMD